MYGQLRFLARQVLQVCDHVSSANMTDQTREAVEGQTTQSLTWVRPKC
jgi:hypothetical protein